MRHGGAFARKTWTKVGRAIRAMPIIAKARSRAFRVTGVARTQRIESQMASTVLRYTSPEHAPVFVKKSIQRIVLSRYPEARRQL
jgi:hypothetical protein